MDVEGKLERYTLIKANVEIFVSLHRMASVEWFNQTAHIECYWSLLAARRRLNLGQPRK